jgi:hypothetical protein
MFRISRIGALSLLALSVGLAGCGSSGSGTPQGRVRVINAALGANAGRPVDVNIGGQTFTNVGYGAVSSNNLTLNANQSMTVGVNSQGTGTSLGTGSVTLAQGVDQTVLIAGGAAGQPISVFSLGPQDYGATAVSGQARVYFVNAAPTVNPSATASFTITPTGGVPVTVNTLNYGEMSAQRAVVGSANTTVSATIGGETITSPVFDLKGGNTYSIVLTGRPTVVGGTPGLQLQVIQHTNN